MPGFTLWNRKTDPSGDVMDKKITNGKYALEFSHIYWMPHLSLPKTFGIKGKEFTLYKIDYLPKENKATLYINVTHNSLTLVLILGVVGLGIFTFFTLDKVTRLFEVSAPVGLLLAGGFYFAKHLH